MDFENPFADEEEPEVIPNEPLLDYDEGKREEDFNALVVRASNLERNLVTQATSDSEALTAATQRQDALSQTVAEQRKMIQIRQLDLERAETEKAQSGAALTAATRDVLQSVMTDLSCRVREHAEHAHKLESSAGLYARKLASIAEQTRTRQAEAEAAQMADRPALLSSALQDMNLNTALAQAEETLSERDAAHVLDLIEDVVAHYTQRDPQEVAQHCGSEEVGLALAVANNVADALSTITAIDAHASHQARALRRCAATLDEFDATRLRLARLLDQQQSQAAAAAAAGAVGPTTAGQASALDVTAITNANASLRNENRRLERALASLTAAEEETSASAAAPSPPLPRATQMALHIAAMEQQEAEVEREAVMMGKEVLRLRRCLAASADAPAQRTTLKVESARPSSMCSAQQSTTDNSASSTQHVVDALSQLAQALATLPAPHCQVGETADRVSETEPLTSALTVSFKSLAELQRVCLAPLQTINDELQKQAFTACFLRRLARHGTDLCGPVVKRVLEGCSAWSGGRAQEVQEEVRRACEVASAQPNTLQNALEHLVTDATPSASPTSTAGTAAAAQSAPSLAWREGLYNALIRCAVGDDALQSQLLAQQPHVNGLTPLTPSAALRATPDSTALEATLAARVAFAEEQYRAFVTESSSVLRERAAELEKKLTWFDKQPYTTPVRDLYKQHKQNEAVVQQLAQSDTAGSPSREQAEAQLQALRDALAAQTAEARQSEMRLEELRQRHDALTSEESAALAFLRA